MRETNPAVNRPAQALAQHFIKSEFDMKVDSHDLPVEDLPAQLVPNEFNSKDKTYFSRYYPSAECRGVVRRHQPDDRLAGEPAARGARGAVARQRLQQSSYA